MWRIVDFQTGGPTVSPLLLIYMCWKSNMISDGANCSILLAVRCRWGDVQCHALSTQTTQDSPGAEPRRSKRKLRQIFGIKLNRQLILFQTHILVAGTRAGHRHPNWTHATTLVTGTQAS